MKQWVLTTYSESRDTYVHFIEHPTKPTHSDIQKFLSKYSNDFNLDTKITYESYDQIYEVKDFKKIPDEVDILLDFV